MRRVEKRVVAQHLRLTRGAVGFGDAHRVVKLEATGAAAFGIGPGVARGPWQVRRDRGVGAGGFKEGCAKGIGARAARNGHLPWLRIAPRGHMARGADDLSDALFGDGIGPKGAAGIARLQKVGELVVSLGHCWAMK